MMTKNEIDNYEIKSQDHFTREIYLSRHHLLGHMQWPNVPRSAPLGQWSTFNRDCVISMIFEFLQSLLCNPIDQHDFYLTTNLLNRLELLCSFDLGPRF